MTLTRILAAIALLAGLLAGPGWAQEPALRTGPRPERPAAPPEPARPPDQPPADAVTAHVIQLDGHPLSYKATAGTLALRTQKGDVQAHIFYVAYTRDPDPSQPPDAARPITFAFNGGPGAASAYLNLGALGPRRLQFPSDGSMPAPPYQLVDNADSWLGFTDLVFIDPPGTGYTTSPLSDADLAKQFFGVTQDTQAIAAFIRRYLVDSGRMLSPVYLVGESYGGFRAAMLAHDMETRLGVAPAGLFLLSPVLEFQLMNRSPYDVLPWALTLPSFAAAMMAGDGALPPDIDARLALVESYALGDYLTGLAAGRRDAAATARFEQRMAEVTGLPLDVIQRQGGKLSASAFLRLVRRDDNHAFSAYDASVAGVAAFPYQPFGERADPVLTASVAPFTSAFTAYARAELDYRTDAPYRVLADDVGRRWDFGHEGRGQAGAMDELRQAIALNPRLSVVIGHGYTDLVTPYFMTKYLIGVAAADGPPLPISLKLYPGGHMMYVRDAARAALKRDAQALYGAAH